MSDAIAVYRLDDEEIPTGLCGMYGCEEPAYMYGCEVLPEGYVDACPEHAPEAVAVAAGGGVDPEALRVDE